MIDEWTSNIIQHDPMRVYRARRDAQHTPVTAKYGILGFISSGTYGRVYKAHSLEDHSEVFAIKKFKPDKEGDVATYTGISQSAIREIALNREINHENVVALREVILEDKSIYMVFEYAEHDFLQVIHHYYQTLRTSIPTSVLKSLIYQLINGLIYLHASHILHRDLKPANILITSQGVVKIGDLGLARLCTQPLQPLVSGDKVVVTIWYRAPELLLGAKHYNKAIDCWAVGCVMAELASLRPIFKGEEAKLDSKKNVPFQKDQMLKILDILGTPSEKDWPGIVDMPEYQNLKRLDHYNPCLERWCQSRLGGSKAHQAYDLLRKLFIYDPDHRLTAEQAIHHKWFHEDPLPTWNAFQTGAIPPSRRVTQDDAPSMIPQATATQQHTLASHVAGGAGHGVAGPPFSKPGSSASFGTSMSGGGYGAQQGQSGNGGHTRKKARLG
ncbi:hypothetical protein NMY22_g8390 [Coprinellus aureogranulatus]|nr:hypothetical protein NMY22_g8390 [Coprinellus aureogranulatus]